MATLQKLQFGDLYLTPSRNGVSKPSRIRGNGYRMINMGEIFKYDRINDLTTMELVPLTAREISDSFLQNEDLLFARQSLVIEGAGKCSIYLGNSTTTTFESHLIRVRLDKNKVEPHFYYYYFTSLPGKSKIRSIVNQVAAAGIRGSDLAKLVVDVPDLPTQKIIVSILINYDELIERNKKRIMILEEMAQRLYTEWFVKFKFPGHEKVKMVNSGTEFGMIPEGWDYKSIDSVISYHIGGGWGSDVNRTDFPKPAFVIRGTDIDNVRFGIFDKVPFRFHSISNLKSRILNIDDIIFEVSGGSPTQPLGRCLLITKELLDGFVENVICASFCKKIVPNQNLLASEILYLSLLEAQNNGEITSYQIRSTGISNFKWNEYIKNTFRYIPPRNIQNEFKNLVAPLLSQISVLGRSNTTLRNIRDLLIPQLVSGKRELKD